MQLFDSEISKDESGRLTVITLPFPAREVFAKPKGTIYVNGTINGIEYRGKLLARGGGRFVMVLDKALQKAIGFDGTPMAAHVAMAAEDSNPRQEDVREPVTAPCGMDVLTAIKTRKSIRRFTAQPLQDELLDTILYAGLCAPTAKNKRPCHFVVIRDRQLLFELAQEHANASMLKAAACAIVVCGDKSMEGTKEFLYADCAAATQNMLLCIHGFGLGGVWCGVPANSAWRKLLIDKLALPPKLEPIAVIAAGWPAEEKELSPRWDVGKIHYDKW